MRIHPLLLALCLGIGAIGCAPQEVASRTPEKSVTGANGEPKETPKSKDPVEAGGPTVPAELKTEGYRYFGVENSKTMTFTQKSEARGTEESSQTTTFEGVENGVAKFKTTRSGASASVGESELIAKADGLYTTSVGGVKLDKPSLEVPGDLAPGKTWNSDSSFTLEINGKKQPVSQKMVFKAEKIESVKTPGGTFEALKIVGSGQMTAGSISGKNVTSMWFVKDVGLVKMTSQLTNAGKIETILMELKEQK